MVRGVNRRKSSRYRSGARRGYKRTPTIASAWYSLISLIIVCGVVLALALVRSNDTIATITGQYTATGPAADVLNSLTVEDNPRPTSIYKRDLFGFRETDVDGNGCDVREDVLSRDLTDVVYKSAGSCKVASGVLHDPYTGKTIHFTRGAQTSKAVQIDHVVALSNAWKSGAHAWSTAQRYTFSNDPYNLLAVDGHANQQKEDAAADEWLPSNTSYDCPYVARQIGVKAKYSLTVTSAEKNAMLKVLHSCPAQAVPQS
ncbi:HNH endonuclease family protein [Alloscardovia criceti]|uniref:HNH endonuclease family protein n=1 Tax=Alloscardovia criceti TaxID=356828 RepID=UPI00036E48E0|nr:HNH endonuclease family protein [Alloscardovia criceti]